MFVSIGMYKKLFADSVLLLSDQLLSEISNNNNEDGYLPAERFDAKKMTDFVDALHMMKEARDATPGLIGTRSLKSTDTLWIITGWESEAQHDAFRASMTKSAVDEIFLAAKRDLVDLLGLGTAMITFTTDKQLSELTHEEMPANLPTSSQ